MSGVNNVPLVNDPVGIIGAGPVAQALGRLLLVNGAPVVAITSRSPANAVRAAAFIGPSIQAVSYSEIPRVATRIIIAVADEGIASIAESLASFKMTGLVLHTSGASGLKPLVPLREAGVACGMLHPLQTIVSAKQGVKDLKGIAFGLAGDHLAVDWGKTIVSLLHGEVLSLSDQDVASYHAGAVMASNALVAAIDAAMVLMNHAGIESEPALRAIGPLCRASVENAMYLGPKAALTGPIVRGDAATVGLHLAATKRDPSTVGDLYRATALHLLFIARQRNIPKETLLELEKVLEI